MINPYWIKEIVEELLAIKYKGKVEENDRDKFEEEYQKLFIHYKVTFGAK